MNANIGKRKFVYILDTDTANYAWTEFEKSVTLKKCIKQRKCKLNCNLSDQGKVT